MDDFSVGDRVQYEHRSPGSRVLVGMTGTVVDIRGNFICVCWDDDVNGHDCRGLCQNGHGWNVAASSLSRVETGPFAPAPLPDFEALFSCTAQ